MYSFRVAEVKDAERIVELLYNIADFHEKLRPDVFKSGVRKFGVEDILKMYENPDELVYVVTNEEDYVVAYCIAVVKRITEHVNLCDKTSLYIDDLCVDSNIRGGGIGKMVMEKMKEIAINEVKADNIELNVWNDNISACKFYENIGFKPLRTIMEVKL